MEAPLHRISSILSVRVGVDVMRLRDLSPRSDLGKFFHLMDRQFTREGEWPLIKEGRLVRLSDKGM